MVMIFLVALPFMKQTPTSSWAISKFSNRINISNWAVSFKSVLRPLLESNINIHSISASNRALKLLEAFAILNVTVSIENWDCGMFLCFLYCQETAIYIPFIHKIINSKFFCRMNDFLPTFKSFRLLNCIVYQHCQWGIIK